MDTNVNPQIQAGSAPGSTGCCGAEAKAQPQLQPVASTQKAGEAKLTKSSCCCRKK